MSKPSKPQPEKNLSGEILESMYSFHVMLPLLTTFFFVVAIAAVLIMHRQAITIIKANGQRIDSLEQRLRRLDVLHSAENGEIAKPAKSGARK